MLDQTAAAAAPSHTADSGADATGRGCTVMVTAGDVSEHPRPLSVLVTRKRYCTLEGVVPVFERMGGKKVGPFAPGMAANPPPVEVCHV